MKRLFNNRHRTGAAINEIINYLGAQYEGFNNLSKIEQLKLGMQFYQCERGRLQKGKMIVDILSHLIPLAIAIGTYFLLSKK